MLKRKQTGSTNEAILEKRMAIDIGFSSIKFAYFKENLLFLEEFPIFDGPKDIKGLKQQELLDSQKSVISKAISMINPKADFILCPQPSLQVLTRLILRPSDTDIKKYLEKAFPVQPDQFSFDTHYIDLPPKDKKAKKSEKRDSRIAVAVSDLDFIQRSIGLLGEFQLQIKRFIPSPVALLNYLALTSNGNKEQPMILLDLGALFSHLIIFKGMKSFLARTIALGGNDFNRELVQKLNVDFETAEKIKTERKLIDDSLFESKGSSTSMPMFQAVNSLLYDLVDEIKNSMTFFEDYFLEDLSTGTLFIAGGSSNLQNLDRFLNKEIDLPVKKVDTAIHALAPNKPFLPQFASSIGLLGDPSHPGLLDINLINNIEGMLFKLEQGDYFLTKEGFVDKKGYRKKQRSKTLRPTVTQKSSGTIKPALSPLAFLQVLPQKITSLIKGEKVGMSELRINFREMDFSPVKRHMKTIFIVLGAVFLVLLGGYKYYWTPMTKKLDRTVDHYLSKRIELDKAKGSLMVDSNKLVAKVTRADKLLWADKLKAIAAAIPEKVWVSRMELRGNELVLACHVYSSEKDHLNDIALFIKTLKERQDFSEIFSDVKFQSALKDKDNYNFTLTFPLKRGMLEQKIETIEESTG